MLSGTGAGAERDVNEPTVSVASLGRTKAALLL